MGTSSVSQRESENPPNNNDVNRTEVTALMSLLQGFKEGDDQEVLPQAWVQSMPPSPGTPELGHGNESVCSRQGDGANIWKQDEA